MCKSKAEGGQRCAAHTRPAYENATLGTAEWDNAAAAYASTPTGELNIAEEATAATLNGRHEQASYLWAALERGRTMRDMNTDINEALKVEELQAAQNQRIARWDAQSAAYDEQFNINAIDPQLWSKRKMVIFDVETTGPDPETARIVSASIIEVYGNPADGNLIEREWLVNPGVPMPAEAQDVHGISDNTVQTNGLSPATTVRAINTFLAGQVNNNVPIVAYNGSYDLTCLDRESDRHHLDDSERLTNPNYIDPLIIDRAAHPYARGGRKLVAVAARHGYTDFDAHNATADCLATAHIAHSLAQQKPALHTDINTLRMWQNTWHDRWNTKMNEWVASKGGDTIFDTPFGVAPQKPQPAAA